MKKYWKKKEGTASWKKGGRSRIKVLKKASKGMSWEIKPTENYM